MVSLSQCRSKLPSALLDQAQLVFEFVDLVLDRTGGSTGGFGVVELLSRGGDPLLEGRHFRTCRRRSGRRRGWSGGLLRSSFLRFGAVLISKRGDLGGGLEL